MISGTQIYNKALQDAKDELKKLALEHMVLSVTVTLGTAAGRLEKLKK